MVLSTGQWPHADAWGVPFRPGSAEGKRAGKDLAGGFKAVVWVLKGKGH